jgi:prephenate dehydratase
MKRIAIQGEIGSFHDIAAHEYFKGEQIELTCCETFEEIFAQIRKDPTIIGMMAIENTIAGSILHNYALLQESDDVIVGESKLHIQHCICCLPEDDWATLKEVHSHPVALAQCRHFLDSHPDLKAVESIDTAGSAADISKHHLLGMSGDLLPLCSPSLSPEDTPE